MIALLMAVLAILTQPTTPPQDFTDGVWQGQPIVQPGVFVGMEWQCAPDDDESCYAGMLWIISEDGQSREPLLEAGP